MAEKSTFIKIDRNITEWGWYQDANTFRVFIHLLIKASIKDREYAGIILKRGEYITTYERISTELKLSIQQARTAIEHLKYTGEITITRHSKFQVISIKNYDFYQSNYENQQSDNNQITINQQSDNNQITIKQECKEEKECKECKEGIVAKPPQPSTQPDVQKVVEMYHEICISYPKIRSLSENRKKAVKARIRTYGLDAVREVFQKAEASDFLKGRNNRNWSANFDWMMTDSNFCKIFDGNYDNKQNGGMQNAEQFDQRFGKFA